MPLFLQEHLIQRILRPLSCVMKKIPCAVREAVISLSIAGIFFVQFAELSDLYRGHYRVQFAIGCLLFGVMILCSLTPDLKPVRFSPVLTVCWLVIIFSIFLTGVLVNKYYLTCPIMLLAVFPIIYLVWSGPGFDRFIPLVIRGVLLSFFFFIAVSVFFYPLNGSNYASFFTNRNATGQYLVTVFACLLCYIFTQDRYSLRMFVADAAIGFAAATLYYTNCRTAIFTAAICFLFTGALQILTHKKKWLQVVLFQLLPVVAAVVLLIPTSIYLYHGGYRLAASTQATVNPSDIPDVPMLSGSKVLDTIKDYNAYRFHTEGIVESSEVLSPVEDALNNITAGRVELWRIYLREVDFLGHDTSTVVLDSTGTEVKLSSHFTVIQFSYQYGVLAGVFFLLLNILAGLSSIRFADTRQDIKYRLFPFAIAITFGAESVMEIFGGTVEGLFILYFLSLAPLFTAPPERKELA